MSEINLKRDISLKPCPFCGGKPYLESSSRGFINGQSERIAYVRCSVCNARSPRIPLSKYGKTSYSKEANLEVAELWNRRV